tara:strand:- start:2164 stop:3435 length:1272 start_codon:yes stop_codon:yes gene_type:complete
MNNKKNKQKEIICLHTHRCKNVLLATMRSAPRNALNIKRANKCDYLIFSLNVNSNLYQDYLSSVAEDQGLTDSDFPPEFRKNREQDEGFMICKISGIRKLSKRDHSNIHPDDPFYEITFKEHASIKIPSLYENKKNPVSYFSEDEILKLLNIQDFRELEWSKENDLEPVFDDPDKYPIEHRDQIDQQNYWIQLFRDSLAAFLEREMHEIVGKNIYIDGSDTSKELFIQQFKKDIKEGKNNVNLPFDVKSKEGEVVKVLRTIEEFAGHQYWLMKKSGELREHVDKIVEQKLKQGKSGEEILPTWEEYQEIAQEIGIEIEETANTADLDNSGGIQANFNYKVPVKEESDILSELSESLESKISFMKFSPDQAEQSYDKSEQITDEQSYILYKVDEVKDLSIDEAKIGLSKKYGIPIENIEVILKG